MATYPKTSSACDLPTANRHLAANVRVAMFARELRNSYAAAGKPMSDDTLTQVAAILASALPEVKDAEIASTFAEARNVADIPTQRTLKEAHLRIRERADRNPVKNDWPDGMSYREYVLLTGDRRISELANRPRAGFAL